jgi:adenine-specific DNA-methyltransferase
VFREDANHLISRIEADIVYLDPPYNSRQYVPYYHILETATRWDSPAIYGKTGRRPYQEEMSQYCKKERVGQALSDLIVNAKCKHVLLSYSSDGLLTEEQIRAILSLKGDLKVYKRNYRRYKSNGGHSLNGNKGVNELLFYVKVGK